MEISKQIKEHRNLKKFTQKDLGELLNVSDKTISSWETGRTYPDIQLIVKMSDIFDVSLDELLKGDQKVVEKIAKDTKNKEKLTKKIRFLWLGIILLMIVGLYFGYRAVNYQELSTSAQIESVDLQEDKLLVKVKLPFYRSVGGYMMDSNSLDSAAVDVRITSTIDWTFKNTETIEIPLEKELFQNPEQINIVGANKIIDTLTVK